MLGERYSGGTRQGRRATAGAALAATAALVWGVGLASGAVGDLTYQGCYTGETEAGPGPGGNGSCAAVGTTTSNGSDSGLDNVRSTVVSPDGTSLYATTSGDSSVIQFARDPATGALSYLGCISGETASAACTQLPKPSADGDNSGLSSAQSIAISPDGNSVYVAAENDDAVARFRRTPGTGLLTYQDCITGEDESGPGPAGSDACSAIASADLSGNNSGLDDPQSIALTDGSLYVAARGDDAVARFSRNPATGALSYQGCITGETESGPPPPITDSGACAEISSAASSGTNSGLDVLQTVALSPDGASLYTASQLDSAVGRFDRNASTGGLRYQGCITGETETGPPPPMTDSDACAEIPSATPGGNASGMLSIYAIRVSPEGNSLYAISENDDSIVRFDRAAGGALTYQGCITGETETGPPPPITDSGACAEIASAASAGTNSGLDKLRAVLISPDGRSVYVAGPQDDAVSRFARDPASGDIAHAGCVTGELETGPAGTGACAAIPSAKSAGTNSGLDNPQSLAISGVGTSFYVGAANDAGIARFAGELEAPAPPGEEGDTTPPDTSITKGPKKKTKKKHAEFEFTASEPGASFQCSVDHKTFHACTSGFEDKVKKGKHDFEVRAIDAAGNVDPTPATYNWRVKKKKKH
jgi:6-phosphogluconolactonase (cycloisomerase 2 family)